MKQLLYITFSFLFMPIFSSAQMPVSAAKGMGGQMMNSGQFYGKLVDAKTNKPIEAASIQLMQNQMDTVSKQRIDKTLGITLSDKKGDFLFDQLPVMGSFKLLVSAVGYKPIEKKIRFDINMGSARNGDYSSMLNAAIKDLGNIKMDADSRELQNVTVTASKPLMQMNIDRKVYNVEKDLTATGGTAVDIMRNIPSLNVDIDGNVSLRNTSPQIFVDGRPTTLQLDQIPSDQIASVELITNPSAKYDASGGGGGILNIVLKKNRRSGYNGNLRASINSFGMPGGGGDINIRQGKVNLFMSAMVNTMKSKGVSTVNRIDYIGIDSISNNIQNSNPEFTGGFGFARLGLDYLIDNRNTLTLSGSFSKRKFNNDDDLNIYRDWEYFGAIDDYENGLRTSDNTSKGGNFGTSANFKHNFAKAGKEWTIDGYYNSWENKSTGIFGTQYFDASDLPKGPLVNEKSKTNGNTKISTLQTDFVNPISKTLKIESGLRFSRRTVYSHNESFIKTPGTDYIPVPALENEYKYVDEVYAGYATFSQQIKKFSYQAGLRIESSKYTGNFISKTQLFGNEYPFSLFPSVFLTYSITKKQDVQVNYSRRINRPNFWQLVPFIDYTDSLNLSQGNPDLIPEFSNLGEISYSNQYKPGHSLLLSIYGRYTDDLITKYQFKMANPNSLQNDTLLMSTYANANSSFTSGLEITSRNKATKWWDINTNLNFFFIKINAGNLPGTEASKRFSWFGKVSQSFTLPKKFSVQLNADYQAKTLLNAVGGGVRSGGGGGGFGWGMGQATAQGYIKPNYGFDLSVRKNFLKGNAASITVQWSDIFRTRKYEIHSESIFFVQDNYRRRNPQMVRINFNYRFGKMDVSLFKRKNIRGEMDSMQDMNQGGGQGM
ncbi:MAG: TonB-dependent receptor [Ferruginibacter sp.]|nr:TonB-dependent receptor [Ferruginibacter sp.]